MIEIICDLWWQLFIATVLLFILFVQNVSFMDHAIFGIYRTKPKLYFVKFAFMYILLKIRKRKVANIEDIERRQPLSNSEHAIDAVYFNGSSDKRCMLAAGTAIRKNRLVNGFFMMRIPEFNNSILVPLKYPDTCLYQTELENMNYKCYNVEGIKLTPIIPMESWKIEFNGKMMLENDKTQIFDVIVEAKWNFTIPQFNYDVDINPQTISRAIACETWSQEYFRNLENYHQTHYEQYGNVKGIAKINGKEYDIFTNSVRDHSFGYMRDWKNFHRYVMHFLNLENGNRISVGIISIPVTFSSIEVGFISFPETRQNVSITKCDLKLWQHGETSEPPNDYAFSFWTGKKRYVVKIKTYQQTSFYIGEEAECRIVEQFCECNVNGIKGWGAAEWQYRHIDGLPID